MFTLSQLECLVLVAKSGSFSAAARKLRRAQSAVSTAISNLEIELGLELFDRNSRLPTLTAAGRIILESAEPFLRQSQAIVELAHTLEEGVESQINLVIDDAVPLEIVEEALVALGLRFTQLQVHILKPVLHSAVELVETKRAVLGVALAEPNYGPAISFRRLGDVALANVVALGHPLAALDQVTFTQLQRHRQLVYAPHVRSLPTAEYLQSALAWFVNSYEMLLRFLKKGQGWAILPKHMIKDELSQGLLIELQLEAYPVTEWQVGLDLIWSSNQALGLAGLWLKDFICQHISSELANTARKKK